MFNPFDDTWWRAGSQLNWWDSTLDTGAPSWLPTLGQAREFVMAHPDRLLRLLGLVHSYRTLETGQAHMLNPSLPSTARNRLVLSLAALRLVDLGFPVRVDGRTCCHPARSPFTALRLPAHRNIEPDLAGLGFTPVEIACLGPGPLRGARQYDRHNLICASLAGKAREAGWLTCGETYGRFSLLTGDPLMGKGGPDLQLVSEGLTVCVELTASANQNLEAKFRRWDRVLDHPRCANTHVVWLDAARGETLQPVLERLCADRPRMHAGRARDWMNRISCPDGFTPQPGNPVKPVDWMGGVMEEIGRLVGLPGGGGWRRPQRLQAVWLG